MGIQNKIEQIRQKPEHIRIRYAWFFAISGTLFVVFIWVVSFNTSQESTNIDSSPVFLQQQFEKQGQSLQNSASDVRGSFDEMTRKAEEMKNLEEESRESGELSSEEEMGVPEQFLSE